MIDTLLSSALNDSEISHEVFTNIINEANIKELTIEPSSLKSTIITSTYKILLMIKIITCAYKILIIIKIITCTYKRRKKKLIV